ARLDFDLDLVQLTCRRGRSLRQARPAASPHTLVHTRCRPSTRYLGSSLHWLGRRAAGPGAAVLRRPGAREPRAPVRRGRRRLLDGATAGAAAAETSTSATSSLGLARLPPPRRSPSPAAFTAPHEQHVAVPVYDAIPLGHVVPLVLAGPHALAADPAPERALHVRGRAQQLGQGRVWRLDVRRHDARPPARRLAPLVAPPRRRRLLLPCRARSPASPAPQRHDLCPNLLALARERARVRRGRRLVGQGRGRRRGRRGAVERRRGPAVELRRDGRHERGELGVVSKR
ncbi:uncharacterized protein RHOBADRAFT_55896, partial [Rhodotorula graminis WP1]